VAKNRIPIWLALIAGAFGLPPAAILGLWTYKSVTTPILHSDPQQVRSVTHSHPSRKWTDAVERGRQIMRAGLIQQNLPGLSVAVGVDGDIVWAEGFGWADLENQVPVAPDTGFRVADASKALTSAAVGLLLEKNTLHLDDEIQVHLPEFPKKQWPVTLRQLMAQVAGVPTDHGGEAPLSNTRSGDGNPARRCERTVDGLHLDNFAERELLFEPGARRSTSRGLGLHGIPDMGQSRRAWGTIPATPAPPRSYPRRLTWCGSGWAPTAASAKASAPKAASC
jgi:serine beta-lactamase-like protein LACTB